MSDIISSYHFDTGTRELYEDRVMVKTIERPNRDRLTVGVVADGVGGENRGERAAQLAIDALFNYMSEGQEREIIDLLINGVFVTNQQVFAQTRHERGTSCTLAVAVIHNGTHLYVANVGDSRVYLLRNRKLTQLTMDHTFRYLIPIEGEMSPQAAAASPRAEVLMRAIGLSSAVEIDVGFHLEAAEDRRGYLLAQSRGKKGLPLQTGDAILVCSDGLIKSSPTDGTPLILTEEIVQVLTTQEGERAARGLVSFALGRNADDNVSVAVLQTPDPERSAKIVNQARTIRRRAALIYGSIILAVLAISAFTIVSLRDQSSTAINQEQTRVAEANLEVSTADARAGRLLATAEQATRFSDLAAQATGTVRAILAATETARPTVTPTPTATPRATLQPGQIGFMRYAGEDGLRPLYEDEPLLAERELIAEINHAGVDADDASLYVAAGSDLTFPRVDRQIELRLFAGSNILLETGPYQNGAEVDLRTEAGDILLAVTGSCMGVDYQRDAASGAETITAFCFEGNCTYRTDRNAPVEIPTGQQMVLNGSDLTVAPAFKPISQTTALTYLRLLQRFNGYQADVNACLRPYLPPPPTATPTATIFVPTEVPSPTPKPKQGSNGQSSGGSGAAGGSGQGTGESAQPPPATPSPQFILATQVNAPTATEPGPPTALPQSTSTPQVIEQFPTATPLPPPSNTPIPSTATRPPEASNTPVPAPLPTETPPQTLEPTPTAIPETAVPSVTLAPPANETPTPVPIDTPLPQPTETERPQPQPSNTPAPLPTETVSVPETATPLPAPTETAQAVPTETVPPPATNTPQPPPTGTAPPPEPTEPPPAPPPSSTPVPLPTSTPKTEQTSTPLPPPTVDT